MKFPRHLVIVSCAILLALADMAIASEACRPFVGKVDAELLAAMRISAAEGRLYRIVPGQSKVGFCVRHFPFQELRGEFTNIVGGLALPADIQEHGQALLLIHSTDMDASNPDLIPLLQSHEFMDTERYPEILFVGHSFEWHTHPLHGHIYGDLTLHGRTQPVVFDIEFEMLNDYEHARPARIFLSGTSQVNRMKFDMRSYRLVVSQTVRLCLSVELVPWDN
ncbi:MAG: YceI family protein [Gammaproteobacteria bacterium]|nr:YceI family protein [Gammaproteobacteria bacterium]